MERCKCGHPKFAHRNLVKGTKQEHHHSASWRKISKVYLVWVVPKDDSSCQIGVLLGKKSRWCTCKEYRPME